MQTSLGGLSYDFAVNKIVEFFSITIFMRALW